MEFKVIRSTPNHAERLQLREGAWWEPTATVIEELHPLRLIHLLYKVKQVSNTKGEHLVRTPFGFSLLLRFTANDRS